MINVNQKVQNIARICHEVNRALQIGFGEEPNPRWDILSEDLKNSTYSGVNAALDGATPEDLHTSWCDERMENGWTYGYPLDRVKKIHPNLVPYEQLSQDQQIKDHVFETIVRSYRS